VIVQMIYVLSSVYNDCMRPNPQEQRSMWLHPSYMSPVVMSHSQLLIMQKVRDISIVTLT
jgi:hypothetical protein